MKIYLDNNFMCHTSNDSSMLEVDAPQNFNGMCPNVIECMRYVPEDMQYVTPDGTVIHGVFIQCVGDADSAQREYERQLLADYESALAEIEDALGV
jgi:hypothetical protein